MFSNLSDEELERRLSELESEESIPSTPPLESSEPSFWESYAKTNKELNKALARGIISLPDLVSAGTITRKLKDLGIDLSKAKYEAPKTPLESLAQSAERVTGSGTEFLGGTLGGFGAGKVAAKTLPYVSKAIPEIAKRIPYVSKPISKVAEWTPGILGNPATLKEASGMAAMGAGLGGLSGLAQEAGVPQAFADVGASLLPTSYGLGKAAIRGVNKLRLGPEYYEQLANAKLRDIIGEENIPEFLESIQNYQPEIPGYHPTTAEVTGNIPMMQQERARLGSSPELSEQVRQSNKAIHDILGNIAPYETGMPAVQEHIGEMGEALRQTRGRYGQYAQERAQKATEALGEPLMPEEVGKPIRQKLLSETEKRIAEKQEKTGHLYQNLKMIKTGVDTPHTHETLDDMLLHAKGSTKNVLENIKGYLKRNKIDIPKGHEKEYQEFINFKEKLKNNPRLKVSESEIKKAFPNVYNVDIKPTPAELDRALSKIGDRINSAIRNGEPGLANELQQVKNALLEDVSQAGTDIPVMRKLYHEHAQKVGEITEHKVLKHGIQQNAYKNEFQTLTSELPHKIIDESLKAPEHARHYMNQIKGDSQALKATEGYISFKVLNEITDASGKVIPDKINLWKKRNPTYETLYPGLDIKLKNVQNAQHFVNDVVRKNEKAIEDFYKQSAGKILGYSPEKVIGGLFQTKNPPARFKEIKDLVKNNKAADEGLQRSTMDYIINHISNAGVDANDLNKLSYSKLEDFLSKHKGSLREIFSPEQVDTLDSIAKTMRNRQKISTREAIGSDTAANLTVLGVAKDVTEEQLKKLIGKSTLKGRIATQALNFFKNIKESGTEKVMNQAFANPQYAKFLLEKPFSSPEATKTFIEGLNKSYLLTPITTREYERQQEEE